MPSITRQLQQWLPLRAASVAQFADSNSYRLTELGRAAVRQARAGDMSPHEHDLLQLCEDGATLARLRQFIPPRTLEKILRELMANGLIEERQEPVAQQQMG